MANLTDLIDRYRKLDAPTVYDPADGLRLASRVDAGATPSELAVAWPQGLPSEVRELWTETSSAELFVDVDYGQWGLRLLNPMDASARTQQERSERPEDIEDGDVVLGEFLGDLNLLVVDAYGRVTIVLPLDPRKDWIQAAHSITEFLQHFLNSGGADFWVAPQ